jgi:hypothetical protein
VQALRAQRVLSTFRGSTWPVLVDVGERKLVVKLRGSAEGLLPLVSEIVVGALVSALGLLTPERSLVELSARLPSDDPHEELRDLLERSAGLNLGFQWLEGYRDVTPADAARIKTELAASIVWLDAFVQNPDRTARNPNLMIKAGQIWLIDHGAALPFHHDWGAVTEQAPREAGSVVSQHLLKVSEGQLLAADAELAPKINRDVLERALSEVPDAFLAPFADGAPERLRAAYVAYLWKRLRAPRPFVRGAKNVPFQFGG